jgi:stage V sporulation protein G
VEITEVRIKLMSVPNDKLRAFCSITIDNNFVIRDLKVIEGTKGPFVAMPSRKLMERCLRCGGKNHHRACYCNDCGSKLFPEKTAREATGRMKLHADIAHPINSRCRELVQGRILERFALEVEKSQDPRYVPQDLDDYDDTYLGDEAVDVVDFEPAQSAVPPSNEGRTDARASAADAPVGAWSGREASQGRGDSDRLRSGRSVGAERSRGSGEQVSGERASAERTGLHPHSREQLGHGAQPVSRVPSPPSPRRDAPPVAETESEDNFGAGIFS